MKQFRVCYTVNGLGYTKDEPWIDSDCSTFEESRRCKEDCVEFLKSRGYPVFDVWIAEREVSEWTKVL